MTTSTSAHAAPKLERSAGLDAMRLFLAVNVVLAHGHFLFDVSIPLWAALFNGAWRIVVPFFFMLTGYFFDVPLKRGLWRWVAQVAIIYLVWSAIYFPFFILNGEPSWAKTVFYLFVGQAHLWYVAALIPAGLMLAMLRRCSDRLLITLAIVLFTLGWVIQWYVNIGIGMENLSHLNAWPALFRNFLFFGFPFMAIGYVMARTNPFEAISTARIWAMLAVVSVFYGIEVWIEYQLVQLNAMIELVWCLLLASPLIFVLCQRAKFPWAAPWMAPLSAELYLVHPLALFLVVRLLPSTWSIEALISLALSVVLAVLLVRTAPLSYLMRLIPQVKKARV